MNHIFDGNIPYHHQFGFQLGPTATSHEKVHIRVADLAGIWQWSLDRSGPHRSNSIFLFSLNMSRCRAIWRSLFAQQEEDGEIELDGEHLLSSNELRTLLKELAVALSGVAIPARTFHFAVRPRLDSTQQ